MRALLLLLLLGLTALPVRAGDELATLEATNRQLKAEFDLAKKPQLYFIFDLARREVLFKSSGIAVATLPVEEVRFWGRPAGDQIRTLVQKDALNPPEREKIQITSAEEEQKSEPPKPQPKPASGEKKKFELQALELDDMPLNFHLLLNDDLRITVRSTPEGSTARLRALAEKAYWYISRPLISDWRYLQKKPYNEILLVLPPKEARMIYWSFTEGAPCLIRWP